MSGGFFRGTSADQDTRFSNKQAKLLKSQKFAPELENLVDVRKVKMDVIRPWIANRVTELLGFEDEVLINFIYGLLDAKEVNGKEVQISLTGFMEKNTGKFMKELWSLLLSAQKNESGVPQQFLDAKAEETQKKQAEVDRITLEIQKKKEKESRELEQERSRKMDGEAKSPAVEPTSRHVLPKDSTIYPADGEETEKNRLRGRTRHSSSQSSRSPSNSRSYSGDRQSSRSVSMSPEGRRSPRKRSIAPRRRHSPQVSPSPPRRISSYSRRRSRSLSHHGSPSPVRRRIRSQFWRRSPSPMRHRSRSPIRRRRSPSPSRIRRSPSPGRRFRSRSPIRRHRVPSPVRRRSRSPIRRRSPSPRRRSPHPFRRKYQRSPSTRLRSHSPIRRRSPIATHRRSPPSFRRRSPSQSSPSPVHHRSPLPTHRRLPAPSGRQSVSPDRSSSSSPVRHRSPIPAHRRSSSPLYKSPSPYGSNSPSPVQNRSDSPARRMSHREQRRSPLQSPRVRARAEDKMSALRRTRGSLRSPVRVSKDRKDFNNKMPDSSFSPYRSPIHSESPTAGDRSHSEERRKLHSPYESPVHQRGGRTMHDDSLSPQKPRKQKPHHEVTDGAWDDGREARSSQKQSIYSSTVTKWKLSPVKVHHKDEQPPQRVGSQRAAEFQSNTGRTEPRKIDQEMKSEKSSVRGVHPENSDGQKSLMYKEEVHKPDETNLHLNSTKDIDRHPKSESKPILVDKVDHSNGGGRFDSGSELSDKPRAEKRKRKHKRSHHRELASDDDASYESEIEGRKEAKKRRKEEKRRRKEEKRRRREERRRRKEERRAEKLKLKPYDASSSSNDEHDGKRVSDPGDDNDAQSEQKKLEIELRKKALESLKAKKGISH